MRAEAEVFADLKALVREWQALEVKDATVEIPAEQFKRMGELTIELAHLMAAGALSGPGTIRAISYGEILERMARSIAPALWAEVNGGA